MKYFEVIFDSNPKVTGLKQGGFQVKINENGFVNKEDYLRIKSFFMTLKYWERKDVIPDFKINVESAILMKGAKLTDFVHFAPHMAGCPFMLNDTAKNLLEKFNLPDHYYWPVKIEKVSLPYKLLYMPPLGFEYVDFKNSLFYAGNEMLRNVKFYKVNSLEEFEGFSEGGILRTKELAFTDKLNKDWDMFNSRMDGLFVSEKLREAIIDSNLSGLNFLSSIKIKR